MKRDGGLERRPVARLIYGSILSGRQLSDGAHGFVFPLSIPVCRVRSNSIPSDQTILSRDINATSEPEAGTDDWLSEAGSQKEERGVPDRPV